FFQKLHHESIYAPGWIEKSRGWPHAELSFAFAQSGVDTRGEYLYFLSVNTVRIAPNLQFGDFYCAAMPKGIGETKTWLSANTLCRTQF
ncbi:MAG TPA: hypothetical protein VFB72_07665, partial [Verrucomicrobiae bacterium]|nr:hypothetical protein [Verrucomicrobiae bacterium]